MCGILGSLAMFGIIIGMANNSQKRDGADILKFPSVKEVPLSLCVGGFAALRFNFPDRGVFSGHPRVINSEEALIYCDLNVYLFYPRPTRQLQMLSCLP